jgi:hypothetical protein
VAPPADSGQPVASWRGRCYWGASLASTDSFGTRLTARDSPMRLADGEEDGGGEAVINGVDKRLPERNRRSVSSRG